MTNKQAKNRAKIFMENSGKLIGWIDIKWAVNNMRPIVIDGVIYNSFGQKKIRI